MILENKIAKMLDVTYSKFTYKICMYMVLVNVGLNHNYNIKRKHTCSCSLSVNRFQPHINYFQQHTCPRTHRGVKHLVRPTVQRQPYGVILCAKCVSTNSRVLGISTSGITIYHNSLLNLLVWAQNSALSPSLP